MQVVHIACFASQEYGMHLPSTIVCCPIGVRHAKTAKAQVESGKRIDLYWWAAKTSSQDCWPAPVKSWQIQPRWALEARSNRRLLVEVTLQPYHLLGHGQGCRCHLGWLGGPGSQKVCCKGCMADSGQAPLHLDRCKDGRLPP